MKNRWYHQVLYVLLMVYVLVLAALFAAYDWLAQKLHRPLRWMWHMPIVQKLALVMAGLSFWFLSRLKFGRPKLDWHWSMPSMAQLPWWLVIGLIVLIGAVIFAWLVSLLWMKIRQPAGPKVKTKKGKSAVDLESMAGPKPPGWPLKVEKRKRRRVRTFFKWVWILGAIGLTVWLILANLIFRDEFTTVIRPHAANLLIKETRGLPDQLSWLRYPGEIVGDGGAPGKVPIQVSKLGENQYRLVMTADTGWHQSGISVRPGTTVQMQVLQPWFTMTSRDHLRSRQETVGGAVSPTKGTYLSGTTHLITPFDFGDPMQRQFYLQAKLPAGGLLLKFGDDGLPKFCGRGGDIDCPGRWDALHPKPRQLLLALNLGQTPEQQSLLSGQIELIVTVVPSK